MLLWHDLRFAFRQLRKTPGFTAIVLATLGLCIGANTAVYSVLDAVLLRPAPYPQPERLAMVVTEWRRGGQQDVNTSQTGGQFEVVRDGVPELDVAASGGSNGANFASGGRLEYVRQQRVSAGFFRVLGVAPQVGREFTRAEDVAGGPALAVISHDFWQRIFLGDPAALGAGMNLRGEPYTVIGIMPAGFRSSVPAEVWTPLRPSRTGEGEGSNYSVIARIKPGATWAAAAQRLQSLGPALFEVSDVRKGTTVEEQIVPLQSGMTGSIRNQLLVAGAAVLMVLLIGCVNIAGLLLARSGARSREIATRMALGGGRAAIVRQLLVESLLLALGGGALGMLTGTAALAVLKDLGASRFESWHTISVDYRVLLAMAGITLLTSLLFGLAPALATARLDLRSVLVEGGRGLSGGRRRWTAKALVAGEVALSLVLLVGAGLLVRTLEHLNSLNPGFDARNILSAQASLQDARYNTSAAVNRLYDRSLERIRRIPGIASASVALTLPYERPLNLGFRRAGGADTQGHGMEAVYIKPDYFETLRIPLLRGRAPRESDSRETPPVVVISESFAKRYFPSEDPLGKQILMGRDANTIVGIAGDVQQHSGLGNFGPVSINPTVYVPVSQMSDDILQVIHVWFTPKWVVRTSRPGNYTAPIQAAIAGVDPQLPIARFESMQELKAEIMGDERYHAVLFSVLAGLALILAAIGLYGLIAQSVAERTREFGIRMALGATAGQAIANAAAPGIALALLGVAAGAILSRIGARLLEHMLWGVKPGDTVTFAATAGILVAVAAVASLVPAFRILRLDPAQTLRND